nr:VanZ family protein [Pullulanibacillus pueri]
MFMPNRCTDIDDVILNTLGALLGSVFYSVLRMTSRKDEDWKLLPKIN